MLCTKFDKNWPRDFRKYDFFFLTNFAVWYFSNGHLLLDKSTCMHLYPHSFNVRAQSFSFTLQFFFICINDNRMHAQGIFAKQEFLAYCEMFRQSLSLPLP